MTVRHTHIYAELPISADAYTEIKAKLIAAGYDHAICDDGAIDMHGIGVTIDTLDEALTRREWVYQFLGELERVQPAATGRRHNLSFRTFAHGNGQTVRPSELVLSLSVGDDWWTVFLDDDDCALPPRDAVASVRQFLDAKMAAEQKGATAS